MPKTSKKPGKSTGASVLGISAQGVWLMVQGKEHFLPHRTFPWFKGASVESVLHVTMPSPGHLYWPAMDVDLHVDGIEHPEKYPVIFAKGLPALRGRLKIKDVSKHLRIQELQEV